VAEPLLEEGVGLHIHSIAVKVLGLVGGGQDPLQQQVVSVDQVHECQGELLLGVTQGLGGVVAPTQQLLTGVDRRGA